MRIICKSKFFATAAAIALASVGAVPAIAQDDEEEATDRIVVTGTRVEGRAPEESLSPIDLHDGAALAEQGSFDLTDQLTSIAPSINTQRFPIADGTAFIRPVSLRNLPPDQTLVLVNGARRHRSALVNLQAEPFGTVNQGAQAVDFGLIPSIAINRLEVLRDGASAQYGSDAIAGVINVILREDPEGFELAAQYGQFYEGDGDNMRISGNVGLPLGPDGFFNFSAEYINSEITSRGSARPDAAAVAAVVGAANVPFNGLGQRWGDPDIEGFRLFMNAGIDLGENSEIYGHGSYADQQVRSGFFYRGPFGIAGVSPRATLCQCADLDMDPLTPDAPLPTDQAIVDAIVNAGLDPADYLTADGGSPSGWVNLNPIWTMFPGGYNPTFGADISDFEGVVGVRGAWGDLNWDFKGRFAESELVYTLENSINPGLGITSPTSFRPGDLAQRELGFNADFVYPWQTGLETPVNVAFGFEYRRETYEIKAGDPESFEFCTTGLIFGVGSDGFQGDSPDAAGQFRSGSYAGYLDIEADFEEWLTIGGAVRYERFNALDDDDISWKVAARVQPNPWIAVRGTVSTGFRTPTPGQINTLDVTTTADSSGNLIPQGTFPVNGVVAGILGASPLEPEDSFSFTAGLVLTPKESFSLTVDYYEIDVDNRIALLNTAITPGSPEDLALIAAGFPGLGVAAFFQNAFDTTVRGIEVTAIKEYDLDDYGRVTIDLRHAWNEQTVNSVVAGTIDPERIFDLENQLPSHRSVFTVYYDLVERFGGFVRVNRYGKWQDMTFGETGSFGSEWLVDVELSMRITENVRFAAGAENVLNNFPDDETNSVLSFLGATRPLSSPFGFNGGFWYVRLNAAF
ncbi:MAG: TonB-dependent receptor [Parvularculaceae bacterium]